MSTLGTGPKWRRGQRSGAVRVWPGGMRAGSTPSGTRLRLNNEAIRKASIGAPLARAPREFTPKALSSWGCLYSALCAQCDDCGPVAQLGERVNRTHEVRGSTPLRSTRVQATEVLFDSTNTFGSV